jgi:hypothetical protein
MYYIEIQTGTTQSSCRKSAKTVKLFPHRIHIIQQLLPLDCDKRYHNCKRLLAKITLYLFNSNFNIRRTRLSCIISDRLTNLEYAGSNNKHLKIVLIVAITTWYRSFLFSKYPRKVSCLGCRPPSADAHM